MCGDTLVLNADMMPVSVIPLSTMIWQDAVKAVFSESVVPVEYYEDWEVSSPSLTVRVPSIVMTKEYIKADWGVGFSAENVFLRDGHRCQYCLEVFPENKLTLDHVVPRTYGGPTNWENITSACSPCNNKRGHDYRVKPMRMPWRPSYWEMVERRRKMPLIVPDASWVDYLQWGEHLQVRQRRNKVVVPFRQAA